MPRWAQTCVKILSQVDSNPQPPDFVADALPGWATAAYDILTALRCRFWDCVRNAAMRFIANENVALSAIAVTARQPAADKPPSLTVISC